MIELIKDYWWLVICILFLLVPIIYNEATLNKKEDAKEFKSGIILGLILLSGLVIPQIYNKELINLTNESIVTFTYFFYLGVLFVLSYYYSKKTFLLRMIAALKYLWIWPKTDKINLYTGIILIVMSPLALILKW